MALTPGHHNTAGVRYRIFDPSAAILRCFSCHSTGPISVAPADESIVPLEPGVRCEVCHGPSAGHARDPRAVHPRNPSRLSASELNDLCGACHRMPSPAGGATDLRNPWNARHQPLMLAVSSCFRKSDGRLNCFTCHAPHAPLEQKLAAYDRACAKCHSSPRHTRPTEGRPCAGCHMPAVRPLPTWPSPTIALEYTHPPIRCGRRVNVSTGAPVDRPRLRGRFRAGIRPGCGRP